MLIVLLVGVGGLVGAVMRHLVGGWAHELSGNSLFPYGTLAVNVLGCFLIGLLAGFAETRHTLSAETRALLIIGLLGGFTTFSAFGYETITLARDGALFQAAANVGLNVALGLGAVLLGLGASEWA